MKALLTPAILAFAALLFGTTLVLTSGDAPSVSPSFDTASSNRSSVFSKPAAICLYQPVTPGLLQPGVHEADPQSLKTFSADRSAVPSRPTPVYLGRLPTASPLQPGVYQTYPWTIILVVPGGVTENGDFIVKPNTNSPMPIIRPRVEVVP